MLYMIRLEQKKTIYTLSSYKRLTCPNSIKYNQKIKNSSFSNDHSCCRNQVSSYNKRKPEYQS